MISRTLYFFRPICTYSFRHKWIGALSTSVLLMLILSLCSLLMALPVQAQRHPPEIRDVYPVGGSVGATTRVTITGVSFRNASALLFDRAGITAKLVPQDMAHLPAPTLDSDGNPEVRADITIAPTTVPGIVHFRVVAPGGVSDVGRWMVGRALPQQEEREPNNDMARAQEVTLPIAIHGRIGDGGDRDVYRVDLTLGQVFVAQVIANQVGSPLDSLLTLQDGEGHEVASNDDYNGPDSLLVYTPKATGRYYLALSSSDGQGGPNYAYRLEMGSIPLLTSLYPVVPAPPNAMAKTGGAEAMARGINLNPVDLTSARGINRDAQLLTLPIPDNSSLSSLLSSLRVKDDRHFPLPLFSGLPLPLFPGTIVAPSTFSPTPDRMHAIALRTPAFLMGRFWGNQDGLESGDVRNTFLTSMTQTPTAAPTFYKFHAETGQRYVIDVLAQEIGSTAYPSLTLYGPAGNEMAQNDTTNGRNAHLELSPPATGDYYLSVAELRQRSGSELTYALTIRIPPSGFTLTAETRARAVGQGGTVPLEVAVNRDRWDGAVTLALRDLPPGVTATTCSVPSGVSRGLLLLTADKTAPLTVFPLHVEGVGMMGNTRLVRTLETAFDWVWRGGARTNVASPADLILFAVSEPAEIAPQVAADALTLARGKSLPIVVKLVRQPGFAKPITLRLLNLPDGVTAADVAVTPDKSEATVELKATPTAHLGPTPITVSCLVSPAPNVQLDRTTGAIMLTVTAK